MHTYAGSWYFSSIHSLIEFQSLPMHISGTTIVDDVRAHHLGRILLSSNRCDISIIVLYFIAHRRQQIGSKEI